MSNLVTITAKFYDKSGQSFGHLDVQSRYQGSSKANTQKADSNGLFVFQASPHRKVELLAKPQNQKDYTVFKTVDSSIASSAENPVKVQLPKTIEEYKQSKQPSPAKGIVSTFFKVVDRNGKTMKNFPVQSRPKGKGNSPDKFTDDQGIVEVKSSPNRDIEVLVLTSSDQFILKSSMNSGNGNEEPILIKLDEPYAKFLSRSMIKILDRDGNDYVIEKTNVEMLIVESGRKQLYSISNGKLALQSMVGQKLEFIVYKPDGKPLKPQPYMATRIKNNPAELHLDVDVTKGTTAANDPEIDRVIENALCPCNRDITIEEFKKIINTSKALTFLKDLNEQFKKFEMNNCLEKAHFIAHTLHETAGYSLMEEGLGGKSESSVYDGYKGRGLMQLTYKKNYEGYGNAVKENFLNENKHRIAKDRQHAVGSAVWYWHHSKAGNLTPHALKNDLIATCALINGGYNGFNEREKYYKKAVSAFSIKECPNLENVIKSRLDDFTDFKDSYIYKNKVGECFGWGLWNDPQGNKDGKTKDPKEAKKGYERFLELVEGKDFPFGYEYKNKQKIGRKRYGYSVNNAKDLASRRVKEL